MKEQSKIASFFFGKRIPVDIAKMDYKELKWYKWNKTCRTITNMVLFLIYNVIFSLGWYVAIKDFGTSGVIDKVAGGGLMTGYGIGHLTTNAIHWITNKFTKEKTAKDMVKSGNPIPKRSNLGVAFLIITILPLIIWGIGSIVILVQCKKYKKENGSYITNDLREQKLLNEKKVDKDVAVGVAKELMRALKEDK